MAIPDRPTQTRTMTADRAPEADGDQRRAAAEERAPRAQQAPADPAPPDEQERSREEEEAAARTAQRKSRIKQIAPLVLLLAVAAAVVWWLHARQYEDTDDAQIDGHISQIGPRISGYIAKVYVDDNQEVKPGGPLVDIDPKDYQVALARAQADYADSQAQAKAAAYN